MQRQQARIARARADEPHPARLEDREAGEDAVALRHAALLSAPRCRAAIAARMSEDAPSRRPAPRPLRRGWTTGACATAAAKAAFQALLTGEFPDPVEIRLPRGETPAFALARTRRARLCAGERRSRMPATIPT